MTEQERVGPPAALVEEIAHRIAARLRPAYKAEIRKRGAAGRSPVPWEDRYEEVEVEAGTADDDTMTVFRAADGCNSLRALTWREVTREVLSEFMTHGESA